MAEDVMTEIENEIRNNKVVMYMKGTPTSPQCGFSAATTEILQDLGKPFHTVDVLSSPEKRDAIKRFSNWPTIPQVYVNGKFIGGCDIVRDLHQRGELQRIVEEAVKDSDGCCGMFRDSCRAPDAAALRASRPSISEALRGLLAGGILYILGALICAPRRPDPFPDVFGLGRIGTWPTSSHASVATA